MGITATRKERDETWYLTRVKFGGGPKIIDKLLAHTHTRTHTHTHYVYVLLFALRRIVCRASQKLEKWFVRR